MQPAERVQRALQFRKPDRVPFIGYNGLAPVRSDILPLVPLTPPSWQPDRQGFYPHVNILQLQFLQYRWKANGWQKQPPTYWKKWKFQPHKEIDEWGVIWEDIGNGTMGWPIEGPLDNWDKLDSLVIPDGNDPARYNFIRKVNKLIPKAWKFRMGLIDNFLFERTHFLRGWERYMRDLLRAPDKITTLIKRILPYFEGMITQLHDMGAQAVFTTDDWGSQEDVLINPILFKKVFMDGYRHITKFCHDLGMAFILHSCGNIGKILPALIEAGVDAVEFDSPRMTGLEVAAEYAGRMCYLDCVDIQTVYPYGTPLEVEQEVKAMLSALGNNGGGLIFIDYATADSVLRVPKANLRAFEHAAHKYGQYCPDGTLKKTNPR